MNIWTDSTAQSDHDCSDPWDYDINPVVTCEDEDLCAWIHATAESPVSTGKIFTLTTDQSYTRQHVCDNTQDVIFIHTHLLIALNRH